MGNKTKNMKISFAIALLVLLSGCGGGTDKAVHYLAGHMTSNFVTQYTDSPFMGCVSAIGIGLLKEAYDSKHGGTADTGDIFATSAGCSVEYTF